MQRPAEDRIHLVCAATALALTLLEFSLGIWGAGRGLLVLFGGIGAFVLGVIARPEPKVKPLQTTGIAAAVGAIVALFPLLGAVTIGPGMLATLAGAAAWPLAIALVVVPASRARPGSLLHLLAVRLRWLEPAALTVVAAVLSVSLCSRWHPNFDGRLSTHLAEHLGAVALMICGVLLPLLQLGRVMWGVRLRARAHDLGLGHDETHAEMPGGGYRSSSVAVAALPRGKRVLVVNAIAAVIALGVSASALLPLVLDHQYPTCACDAVVMTGNGCARDGYVRTGCRVVHPFLVR